MKPHQDARDSEVLRMSDVYIVVITITDELEMVINWGATWRAKMLRHLLVIIVIKLQW